MLIADNLAELSIEKVYNGYVVRYIHQDFDFFNECFHERSRRVMRYVSLTIEDALEFIKIFLEKGCIAAESFAKGK